jgi:hypothetical protein
MGDFCQHEERKARKQHKCIECRGVIPVGEAYHYYSGAWEGKGFSVKRCNDCDSIYHRYVSESNCMDDERPAFSELSRNLFESDLMALQAEYCENQERRKGIAL